MQKEVCPSTQKEHYQVHVELHRQQRVSAMRAWQQTHWIGVQGATHIRNSIKYCSKAESSIEGTQRVVENEEEYLRLHDILLAIADELEPNILPLDTSYTTPQELDRAHKVHEEQFLFKNASKWLVEKDVKWITKLAAPFLEKAWNYYHATLLREAKKRRASPQDAEGPISLSPVPEEPSTATPKSASKTFKIKVKVKHNAPPPKLSSADDEAVTSEERRASP